MRIAVTARLGESDNRRKFVNGLKRSLLRDGGVVRKLQSRGKKGRTVTGRKGIIEQVPARVTFR